MWEQEVFWLTILRVLKKTPCWYAGNNWHRGPAHFCSFFSLWSSDKHSLSSPPWNPWIIIIYYNNGSHLSNEIKSLTAMFRSSSIQCNFTKATITQIKLRRSSVAWISTEIAQEENAKAFIASLCDLRAEVFVFTSGVQRGMACGETGPLKSASPVNCDLTPAW